MGNFYADVIQKDPRFHSTERVADINLLEPITQQAVLNIIQDAKESLGIELMVFETYRSQELQEIYFERGVTQLQKVGVHHYGLAADIVKVKNGQPNWDGDFGFLQKLANKYNLVWGGDWGRPDEPHSFRDVDHVQRITVDDQAVLFAGAFYPDETYNPYA
jgi:hypothetical protein